MLARIVPAAHKLNELSETEYFTDTNKQLLAQKVEECIWREWGNIRSRKSEEEALYGATSIVESWELPDWDKELKDVQKKLGDLRSFNIPVNSNGYSELVAKLELVKPIYWQYDKKDEFALCFKQLKLSQRRRKNCMTLLLDFEKKNCV